MEEALLTFIEAAQAANPNEPIPSQIERVWHIGSNQETAKLIINLVRDGEKVGTFRLPAVDATRAPGERPEVGGYGILTDYEGMPGVMIKTVSMEQKPYQDISEQDVQIDGPAMRDLEAWRDVHWAHFSNQLKQIGETMSQDEPVTIERWTVVYAGD